MTEPETLEDIQKDLPGSVGDQSPVAVQDNHENLDIETRPSTTLEVDSDGVATMSDPSAPPQRLPPLKGSQDGDGLEGYRQNLDEVQGSPGSEVIFDT